MQHFVATTACFLTSLFLALCCAMGIFYIAELSEEHPHLTLRFLKTCSYVVLLLHLLLLLPPATVPTSLVVTGVLAHLSYIALLSDFPVVKPISASSFVSLAMFVVSQWSWITCLTTTTTTTTTTSTMTTMTMAGTLTTAQGVAVMCCMAWFVPFAVFLTSSTEGMAIPLALGAEPRKRRSGRQVLRDWWGRWWGKQRDHAPQEHHHKAF